MNQSNHVLYRFLLDRFTDSELRGLFMFNYPELVDKLPGRPLSFAELAMAVVAILERSGAIDDRFFALLERERPRLRDSIDQIRRSFADPDATSTTAIPVASPARPATSGATRAHGSLRVVFVAANPAALPELQLSAEAKRIEDKLRGTPDEHRIVFDWFWQAGPDSLMDLFFTNPPDVLHYAGHGAENGALMLQTDEGQVHLVTPEALAELIAARPRRPRMIVLNACYSAAMARSLAPLVDVVVGMRGAVADDAARRFAVELYRAIAHGDAIKTAFDTARAALRVYNLPNDDMPQLSVRAGLDARTYRLL